ncbi:unnamed protein product [Brassica oleracea var. botrytis]
MHLIRERYRSFQPLLIDEMMQGQRGWRELAFLGDKVSCYKPDAWAFEEDVYDLCFCYHNWVLLILISLDLTLGSQHV